MLGASARLSCLCTPVETITAPRRTGCECFASPQAAKLDDSQPVLLFNADPLALGPALRTGKRLCYPYTLTGSGYSSPKVSTVTFSMTWGIVGRSL